MALAAASTSASSCLKFGPSSLVTFVTKATGSSSSSSRPAGVCFVHSASSSPNLPIRNTGVGVGAAAAAAASPLAATLPQLHHRRAENARTTIRTRGVRLHAALATETADAPKVQTGQWTWTHEGKPIVVHFKEYMQSANPTECLICLPTLSDVSTTDEWQAVAEGLLGSSVGAKFRIVAVDWPGLGLSERPPINYTADMLEKFLADFMSAKDSLLGSSAGGPPVIVGGGHAATIAARALSKGLVKAKALVAVAPTWAGPLPIVFGRNPTMEFRYGVLRNTLRSPGVGWAMYKYLVSSPKNIRMQYLTHVYADANNVTPAVVESRTALTQRDGARYAPAAFLTGLLDPTVSREELLDIFSKLDGSVPALVLSTIKAPRRSRAEMDALEGAKGVTKFVRIPGALLPQEEFPDSVTEEMLAFLRH